VVPRGRAYESFLVCWSVRWETNNELRIGITCGVRGFDDSAGKGELNVLESMYLTVRKVLVQGIAVVKLFYKKAVIWFSFKLLC